MALTKQFFIDKAFQEIGLAAYVFDMQPEDYATALSTANGMIAEWEGNGVRIGDWFVPTDPDDDWVNMPVAVPATNWRCVWTNLALAIAPNVGKTPEAPTIAFARMSYRTLLNRRLQIPQMQRPQTMPIGTGWNRGIKDRQFYQQRAILDDGSGQQLDINVWTRGDDVQPLVNPTP